MSEQATETTEKITMFGHEVTKVIDENRKPEVYWKLVLKSDDGEVIDENEFYVLLTGGYLVKKGRSKTKSSDYVSGRSFIKFKSCYGVD